MPVTGNQINASSPASHQLALAEADALKAELQEQAAQEDFRSLKFLLHSQGREQEVELHPAFHRWMSARETTDAAWGRWALAMDAVGAAAAASLPDAGARRPHCATHGS